MKPAATDRDSRRMAHEALDEFLDRMEMLRFTGKAFIRYDMNCGGPTAATAVLATEETIRLLK